MRWEPRECIAFAGASLTRVSGRVPHDGLRGVAGPVPPSVGSRAPAKAAGVQGRMPVALRCPELDAWFDPKTRRSDGNNEDR